MKNLKNGLWYYATDPKAMELLLEKEKFSKNVWECACGGGHLCNVLKAHGYDVKASDIVDRGYPETEVKDFFTFTKEDANKNGPRDIITNPPSSQAKAFVEHALDISEDGTRVAMFMRLQFLEGKDRKQFFHQHPPKWVYVSCSRIWCAENGDFSQSYHSSVAYAWFIWEKGYTGEPTIRWFN